MKRVSREGEDGDPSRREKMSKVEPLDALLGKFTQNEDKAGRWKSVLASHDVETLDHLNILALDPEAWSSFHSSLAQKEPMLASELLAWRKKHLAVDDARGSLGTASSSPSELSPALAAFEENNLCAPKDVTAPAIVISDVDPPFLTCDWLSDRVKEILGVYEKHDDVDGAYRKPPMALVRCSRGGKTRALKEIAHALKLELPDAAVIRISFNDATDLEAWEQPDPVGAVCRRIAFAASRPVDPAFSKYLVRVSKRDLEHWLDDAPCVLLIDELNKLAALTDTSHGQCSALCEFLKVFLRPKNRYLIFSSHTVSLNSVLSDYMDTKSGRQILVRQLPLIPGVPEAAQALRWTDLNPRQALYYGLVPSMIFLGHKNEIASQKRQSAIQKCFDEGLVTADSVVRLLKSFVTGEADLIPQPLLDFMNTVEDGKVRWIPCHMMEVLRKFGSRGPLPNQSVVLDQVVSLFDRFCSAKGRSGDAWEALFVVVLLIRALARLFDNAVFPMNSANFMDCSVTFNGPFDLCGKAFESYSAVDEFVGSILPPLHYPHVAVYFPTHALFEEVDVIVAAWAREGARELYGYQLKEGKQLPKKKAHVSFVKSWVIRGLPAQNASEIRRWHTASVEEIDAFFGESGAQWTPAAWEKLSSI